MPKNSVKGLLSTARSTFHKALLDGPLTVSRGIPANADKDNRRSVIYAQAIVEALGGARDVPEKKAGQTAGDEFENTVTAFLNATFLHLTHIRPGHWKVLRTPGAISQFEQYQHLAHLLDVVKAQPDLKASLGGDYLIKPDIVIAREPESDAVLNSSDRKIVDDCTPLHSPLRKVNNTRLILHASVSCKWTIRSDRSQNARTEALNLIRNRKGSVPHAVVVTAEPLPSRLGSIAYGTGDLDCIYHIALPELLAICQKEGDADELNVMIAGRRLRDIADLPLDLAL